MLEFILAVFLLNGAHTIGHLNAASESTATSHGAPPVIRLKMGVIAENFAWQDKADDWDIDPSAARSNRMKVQGSGFKAQEAITIALDKTNIGKKARLVNSLIKLHYLTNLSAAKLDDEGDIFYTDYWACGGPSYGPKYENKSRCVGVTHTALMISMMVDIMKYSGAMENSAIYFTQNDIGTPMIALNHVW